MKLSKIFLFTLLSFFLVMADISFFSAFSIKGATFITSYVVLLIWAMAANDRDYLVIAGIMMIFFAIFSSLPIVLIAVNFFLIPALIHFIREKFFPRPTLLTSLFYFLPATLLFDLIMAAMAREFSAASFTSVLYFGGINTLAGVALYFVFLRFRKLFTPNEIKI